MTDDAKLGVDWDALLATAVQRLVKLDKPEAALALAESSIVRMLGWNKWKMVEIHLAVPGDLYDALTHPDIYANDELPDDFGSTYEVEGSSLLCQVFTHVLPPGSTCRRVEAKIRNKPVSDSWRDEFKASLDRGAVNQGNVPGVPAAPHISRDGLRYRSKTEMRVAEELKQRNLLFFPLPAAVLPGRAVREPDFVVLHKGRVGVLEVHGEPWHPASRAAEENAKSLPYRLAGAEHLIVDATEAYNAATVVVDRLLALMAASAK